MLLGVKHPRGDHATEAEERTLLDPKHANSFASLLVLALEARAAISSTSRSFEAGADR